MASSCTPASAGEKMLCACGLMSGTSCDAVDAAIIWTDGQRRVKLGPTTAVGIPMELRKRIRKLQIRAEAALEAVNKRCMALEVDSTRSEKGGPPATGDSDHLFLSMRFGTENESVRLENHVGSSATATTDELERLELINVEREILQLHAQAVRQAVALLPNGVDVDLIAMHGQTLCHFPPSRRKGGEPTPAFTWQLGSGKILAELLVESKTVRKGTPVVYRFRNRDVEEGGEGAPLAPAYHRALVVSSGDTLNRLRQNVLSDGEKEQHSACVPVFAVLNIGGVSNITVMTGEEGNQLLACDVGPGNALLDDFMLRRIGVPCDRDGASALRGTADRERVRRIITADRQESEFGATSRQGVALEGRVSRGALASFLLRKAPKSCDRDQFAMDISGMFDDTEIGTDDGAATLTLLTAACVSDAVSRLPEWTRGRIGNKIDVLIVCGGGRCNPAMMAALREELGPGVLVLSSDATELEGRWRGDSIEAEAFAYLGVRSRKGLPLSWPGTTGVSAATCGGKSVTFESRSTFGS